MRPQTTRKKSRKPLAVTALTAIVVLSGFGLMRGRTSGETTNEREAKLVVPASSTPVSSPAKGLSDPSVRTDDQVNDPHYPKELLHAGEEREAKVLKVHKPKRELIRHPQFGLVVRLTYDSGDVRFEPPAAGDHPDEALTLSADERGHE